MRQYCSKVLVCAFAVVAFTTAAGAGTIPFIELQPVIVQSSVSDVVVANDITYAQAIFAQIGLDIEVFTTLYSSTLPSTMDSSNTANLATYVTDSTFQPFPILTAWFVSSIGPCCGIRGLSFALTDGTNDYYGIGVASSHAPDTLAHEIAHVLTGFNAWWQPDAAPDGAHSTDPNNLLAYGGIRNLPGSLAAIGTVDQIKPVQAAAVLDSPFVGTPEPASVLLIGSAVAAFGLIRRRAA